MPRHPPCALTHLTTKDARIHYATLNTQPQPHTPPPPHPPTTTPQPPRPPHTNNQPKGMLKKTNQEAPPKKTPTPQVSPQAQTACKPRPSQPTRTVRTRSAMFHPATPTPQPTTAGHHA